MSQDGWLTTDEAQDVAGSIRHALLCSRYLGRDEQTWKWFLLALHAALQGACVCHLLTTADPIGAVKPRNEAEWLAYFNARPTERPVIPPATELMNLPELLKTVRNQRDPSRAPTIAITDREVNWLTRIHREIRNQFVHFAPAGWSIDLSGIPDITRLIARIILEILDHGWAFRHLDEDIRDAMRRDLRHLASFEWSFS